MFNRKTHLQILDYHCSMLDFRWWKPCPKWWGCWHFSACPSHPCAFALAAGGLTFSRWNGTQGPGEISDPPQNPPKTHIFSREFAGNHLEVYIFWPRNFPWEPPGVKQKRNGGFSLQASLAPPAGSKAPDQLPGVLLVSWPAWSSSTIFLLEISRQGPKKRGFVATSYW